MVRTASFRSDTHTHTVAMKVLNLRAFHINTHSSTSVTLQFILTSQLLFRQILFFCH